MTINVRPSPDVVVARKAEIARRYERYQGQPRSPKGRITSIRRTQVVRLLKYRHGATLPNNDSGRAALQVLFELGMDGPNAQRLAPWVAGDELSRLIDAAENNWPFWGRNERSTIAQRLGDRLGVTFTEKIDLKLHHLGCNCDPSDVADYFSEQKRERDRARRARNRQRATIRTEVTERTEPPSYWDLIDSDPRAAALAGGVLDFQWWRLSDLTKEAGTRLGAFRGLRSDTLRQAVHRAVIRLERLGIVEAKMQGRSKYVRRVPSSEDLAALEEQAREQEALEEASKGATDEDAT